MVLSPEHAEGLDLKALTRAAMEQLGRDAGSTPPWIAAIHRNTRHPHVHVVMAARRELEPGHFKSVVINPARLSRMKLAINDELSLQRGGALARTPLSELVPNSDEAGAPHPTRRGRRLALIGSVAQIVDNALRAVAVHQRRELRRWLTEEEQELRRETTRRRHQQAHSHDR
jgi:hypothetical protein